MNSFCFVVIVVHFLMYLWDLWQSLTIIYVVILCLVLSSTRAFPLYVLDIILN